MLDNNKCPCCSGLEYIDCCEKIIKGIEKAETAEKLMRSRYSAHAKTEIEYLINSTAKKYRPLCNLESIKKWAKESEWKKLEIISTKQGKENDKIGYVEFKAYYIENGVNKIHHELSYFTKEDGIWYFNNGEIPKSNVKIGRNDPCSCGSGKKFKKCCA